MQPQQPKDPRSFDIKPSSVPPAQPVTNTPQNQPLETEAIPTYTAPSTPVPPPDAPLANDFAAAAESISTKQRKRDEVKNMLYTILLFILAPLFAIFMIIFVFQSYVVDGSSMEPTLQNGNRVFILKLPKSIASLQNKQYVPARNEVIVFKKPTGDGTQLIKRVIGLPGDRVVIENGIVTVYNIDNPEGFDPDAGTYYEGTLEPIDTSGEKVVENVGEGELFVLGDNRGPGGSLDSHSGLGLVPVENIIGRLWIRYFPISEFQTFSTTFVSNLLAD
jgi:signal peptidase I